MRRVRVVRVVLTVSLVALSALSAGAVGAGWTATAMTAETASPGASAVVVLDSGGCPDPSTLRICEGVRQAIRETGVTARVLTPTFREDLADFLGSVARQGYAAVVMFGLGYTPALGRVAARQPDARFVVIDSSWADVPGKPTNVQGILFRTSEAAYLAGWLAGKLERRRKGRDVVGVVGGVRFPAVEEFVIGFTAGARRAVPGLKVLVDYSNDFVDPTKCAALARRQIARGAGTVFNVAGECGLGTLAAARSAGVWAVGVDTDQSFLGPHVLTSVLKRWDAGFRAAFRQVKAGRVATGRDTVLTMRDGAVGIGRISPKVPPTLVAQLDVIRRRIVSGEIVVPGAVPRTRTR